MVLVLGLLLLFISCQQPPAAPELPDPTVPLKTIFAEYEIGQQVERVELQNHPLFGVGFYFADTLRGKLPIGFTIFSKGKQELYISLPHN